MTQKRVLIVDDDPDLVLAYRVVLESAGYLVDEAPDGASGLRKMRSDRPDLILMDVMMASPLEGYYVTQEISDDPKLNMIPILMVSSISNTQYAGSFPTDQYLNIREFISKPIEPEQLLEKVRRYL
ncbi:MAG: response regulator [Anaerolineae bacterium]|nr:response regulator [Anaerolineae bacterium]